MEEPSSAVGPPGPVSGVASVGASDDPVPSGDDSIKKRNEPLPAPVTEDGEIDLNASSVSVALPAVDPRHNENAPLVMQGPGGDDMEVD